MAGRAGVAGNSLRHLGKLKGQISGRILAFGTRFNSAVYPSESTMAQNQPTPNRTALQPFRCTSHNINRFP